MAQEVAIQPKYNYPRMESVERISKFPAVEKTVNVANNLYGRVKDTNKLVNTVLNKAETTVKGAADIALPVTSKFEGPIKMVDSLLCSSLDYAETKIPAVRHSLDEMYKSTRDSLYAIPGVKCACETGEQGVKKAVEIAAKKFKDVKDSLTQPEENPAGDPNKCRFAGRYSLALKRLLCQLFSFWSGIISKRHLYLSSDAKFPGTDGENSVSHVKKEIEGKGENKSSHFGDGAKAGSTTNSVQEGEKEKHVSNHTKSE